jgi:predicted nucleic acid-binding Zn ribbon protein
MTKKRGRSICNNCRAALPAHHHGLCPNCGKPGTSGNASIDSERSLEGLPHSEKRRDFYERHKAVAVLMMLIIFVFPIIGVFLMGVPGLLLGAATSILGYYLLPYAAIKLRI